MRAFWYQFFHSISKASIPYPESGNYLTGKMRSNQWTPGLRRRAGSSCAPPRGPIRRAYKQFVYSRHFLLLVTFVERGPWCGIFKELALLSLQSDAESICRAEKWFKHTYRSKFVHSLLVLTEYQHADR